MNDVKVGGYVVSIAGHDSGKCYVIIQADNEYVYLVDGRIRTLEHNKKKKIKHVKMFDEFNQALAEKIELRSVKNEEIKRAIKLLQK